MPPAWSWAGNTNLRLRNLGKSIRPWPHPLVQKFIKLAVAPRQVNKLKHRQAHRVLKRKTLMVQVILRSNLGTHIDQAILNTSEQDVPTLIRAFKELGPKMPVITDGPEGAYVVDEDDQAWHMPMYPDPAPPVDRTGAGDSFSSTLP